jgi:hypothetical protein
MSLAVVAAAALCATPGAASAKTSGGACGGIAGGACGKAAYCHMEPGVCRSTADAQGICRPRPDLCPQIYKPVCGCDGRTHPNACMANQAGTSVAAEGACRK